MRVDDPGLDEPLEALLAQDVPAIVEPVAVLGDIVLVRVQRPVRRGVGHEHEQGFIGSLGIVVTEELHGVVGDRVGVEPAVGRCLVLDVLLAADQGARLVEAARALEGAEEAVESASGGPGVVGVVHVHRQMPLAREVGGIARVLEHLGDGRAVLGEVARITVRGVVEVEDPDADLVRV